jgi:hypothetical protein
MKNKKTITLHSSFGGGVQIINGPPKSGTNMYHDIIDSIDEKISMSRIRISQGEKILKIFEERRSLFNKSFKYEIRVFMSLMVIFLSFTLFTSPIIKLASIYPDPMIIITSVIGIFFITFLLHSFFNFKKYDKEVKDCDTKVEEIEKETEDIIKLYKIK